MTEKHVLTEASLSSLRLRIAGPESHTMQGIVWQGEASVEVAEGSNSQWYRLFSTRRLETRILAENKTRTRTFHPAYVASLATSALSATTSEGLSSCVQLHL